MSDFVLKIFFENQILHKNVHSKSHVTKIQKLMNLPRKMDKFRNLREFLKSTIRTQKMFLKIGFLTKNLQRVRFCNKKFETCKTLKQNFYNVSDFKTKILQHVRF